MTLLLMLLFKSLLVFALTGAALLCLRRASASARHLVCLLTLCALLALPAWHLRVLREEPTPSQVTTLPEREGVEVKTPAAPLPAAHSGSAALQPNAAVPSETPRLPVPGGQALALRVASAAPGRFLALLYLLGLILASARPLLGLWGIAHLRRACVDVTDAPTLGVLANCAAALKLKRLPRLCRADIPVPMTWGWLWPVVLLPLASAAWPEDRLKSVLLHEMAHVKRRDWPCHRLADLACALYWFHPFVWLTARRLRAESEVACDDLVLASGIPAPDYARHLLDIARTLPPASCPPQPAAIAMAQTPHIKRRILMILDTTRNRRTVTRRALLAALVPSTVVLVTLAVLRPDAKAQTVSKTPKMSLDTSVQLVGVTDAVTSEGTEWDANGTRFPAPVFQHPVSDADTQVSASADQKVLFVAFRLPPSFRGFNPLFDTPGAAVGGTVITTSKGTVTTAESIVYKSVLSSTPATVALAKAYPAALSRADIRVGQAQGSWKSAAVLRAPFAGKYTVVNAAGSRYSSTALAVSGGKMTFGGQIQTTNDLQGLRFIAVDNKKHREELRPSTEINRGGQTRLTVPLPNSLSHIQEVHIETEPIAWTEFKNVALEPVRSDGTSRG